MNVRPLVVQEENGKKGEGEGGEGELGFLVAASKCEGGEVKSNSLLKKDVAACQSVDV